MKRWIKLYIEILDDPKMGRLPDRLFRRAIELFLLAGKNGSDGYLPSVEDMAWILRVGNDEMLDTLYELEKINIVHEAEPGLWVVTHFKERQDADTPAERMANSRKNRYVSVTFRNKNVTESVTKRNGEEDKEKEEEKEKESEAEAEKDALPRENAPAAAAFADDSSSSSQNPEPKAVYDAEIGQLYRDYEANFGVLSPLLAEKIADLADRYPRDWIRMAFREAVEHEARNIRYVEAILKRWKRDGLTAPGPPRAGKDAGKPGKRKLTDDEIEAFLKAVEESQNESLDTNLATGT